MAEWISIREFARRVGVSDVAVGKAIRSAKIVDSIDWSNPKRPKIDPERAVKEWGKNYDPSYERTEKVSETIVVATKQEAPKPKGTPPTVKRTPPTDKGTPLPKKPVVVPELAPAPTVQHGKSLAEVKRQTAEVKLHLAALELKEKKGELVDKQKVYKALFSAGQEVRTSFQSLPDRVIDDILAAKTRNEAHQLLFNSISDTLDVLSEIMNRDLNI